MHVLETWKITGPYTRGSGERYLRRHWFRDLRAGFSVHKQVDDMTVVRKELRSA